MLAEATADLVCEAWNAGPDQEVAVLLRPVERQVWTVVEPSGRGGLEPASAAVSRRLEQRKARESPSAAN